MPRRVVSLVRRAGAGLRGSDPVLEATAYAVAEDIDLTVLLVGAAVELALGRGEVGVSEIAGVKLPPAAGVQDLRGLVESGVRVVAAAGDLDRRGITADDLLAGVDPIDQDHITALLLDTGAVLAW